MLQSILVRERYEGTVMFKERPIKRTTIILDEEERKFIDSLIKEGKEPGIKPLISKMLDVYRSMMIYDWKFPGEYYSGISRVAFVNVEFIDTLLQFVPKEKWREVGQKIGEAAKISFEATLGLQITDRDKWPEVFKRLRIQGFGDFYLRDKYLILKAPFISNREVFAGLLEKLLGVRLEAKTITPPFIFEIVG
jgi:hypothetical protein